MLPAFAAERRHSDRCQLISLAHIINRLVLPFWYWLTRIVPEKGPLSGCECKKWGIAEYPVSLHLFHALSISASSLFLRLLIASPYLTLFTLFLFPPISSSFFFSTFLRFHPVHKVQLGSLEKCYALPQQGPRAEPWPKHISVHFELKYHDWRHILVTYFHAKVSARKVPPLEKQGDSVPPCLFSVLLLDVRL